MKITDKRAVTTAGGLLSLIFMLIELWGMGYTRITVETVAEAGGASAAGEHDRPREV